MRLTKSNPTGGYSYLSDGVSPASDVLSDGYSAFTPGISEINGAGSRFYLADAQGNSRGLLDAGQGNPDGYNWDAFGNAVSRLGTNPTAYAWNEESGYQSDNDSGLKLLRHRYYDSWTGRFLSQDPAGDGDNWYAYCDNDPMDETDPSGLSSFFDPSKFGTAPGAGPSAWGDYNSGDPGTYDFFSGGSYTHSVTISAALNAAFTSTSGPMMGMGPAGGMFAQPGRAPGKPPLSAYKAALKQVHALVGKLPGSARGKANNGSPMRSMGKVGYRLDPGHVDTATVKYPESEKGIHFNYEDYTGGKRKTSAGVKGAVPVEGGGGMGGGMWHEPDGSDGEEAMETGHIPAN